MHEFHPLHPEAHHRHQALNHVQQTLEIAAQLQVPRIVTVCTLELSQTLLSTD